MFGKTRKQLQAEIDKLKADWTQDQKISKDLLDFRTEECKEWAVKYALLEQEVALLRSTLNEIATQATTMANSRPDEQPCSMDCVMKVNMGPNADPDVWHHSDCPNHTTACCTINDEPKIIKGYDYELAALLDQEEDLRKATTTVWQMADMLSTSTTWILDLCKELDIEAVSHSSRLTPRQVELVSNLAEERRKERS